MFSVLLDLSYVIRLLHSLCCSMSAKEWQPTSDRDPVKSARSVPTSTVNGDARVPLYPLTKKREAQHRSEKLRLLFIMFAIN